ncbi:hypothetical protein B0J14DRAFT_114174 [Halenospora varia]|nr:hypothetical protein B0J14DRAFT_114174 [Halenospora varia]
MSLNTPQLRKLWADAQSRPEWATTKFWEYIFSHNAFGGHQWVVSSQQPPTYIEGDLRRVDLVVEKIDENANSATLLFMEAKRANATLDQVQEVEYQAFTACCANLYATNKTSIWAMTCVGTTARLWAYKYGDDYLTEFFPLSDGLSDKGEYIDFSIEVLNQLEYIKQNFVPPKDVFTKKPPSPRPARATLPDGWHDNEVAYMTGTPESLGNAASGGISSGGEALSSQAREQQLTSQATPLVAEQSTPLIVTKIHWQDGQRQYRCSRPDHKNVIVAQNKWVSCDILYSGQIYQGYMYTGKSGTQYYTWTLEVKGKEAER